MVVKLDNKINLISTNDYKRNLLILLILRKFEFKIWNLLFWNSSKLGGLDLSRRGLDRDSRSRRRQRVSLNSRENLDSVKKLVSTIEISRSRSRYLDFVSTTMSRPKSLDRDRETRRDMTFLANLDSLSRSRSRVSQYYHSSRSRFLNLSRSLSLKSWKSLDYVEIMSRNLENSR